MEIEIIAEVKDENKLPVRIVATTTDIEKLIVAKAKEMRIQGYEGRLWKHLDEKIISVKLID